MLFKARVFRIRSGLSLVEAVCAIFIISSCLLLIMRMVTNGININVRAEQNHTAALVVSRQLETVRKWAHEPDNFYRGNWSTIASGTPFADSDHPGFTVTVQAFDHEVASPCSQQETRFPAAQQRLMTLSYKKVVVKVDWAPHNSMSAVSLIGAPELAVDHLVVVPSGTVSVAPGQKTPLGVVAVDASGHTIPDVFFSWAQSPYVLTPSVGTMNISRAGDQGEYSDEIIQHLGGVNTPGPAPAGNVSLSVEGRSPALFQAAANRWTTDNANASTVVTNQ